MGKEEIECVLCKTYSHSVLSVTAIILPLPSVCLWHVAHASAWASLYIYIDVHTCTVNCTDNATYASLCAHVHSFTCRSACMHFAPYHLDRAP